MRILDFKKITNEKWVNLFKIKILRRGKEISWEYASRSSEPLDNIEEPDAVVIVPILIDKNGNNKLAITKEFRIPILDYEYGFPAGLVDEGELLDEAIARELKEETGLKLLSILEKSSKPVYSCAGLSDESTTMVFCEVYGTPSNEFQEETEDIKTLLYDINDVKELLASSNKIGAKAWSILWHFKKIDKIDI